MIEPSLSLVVSSTFSGISALFLALLLKVGLRCKKENKLIANLRNPRVSQWERQGLSL